MGEVVPTGAPRPARAKVRFRRLQRFLPAGTVLELSITKHDTVGQYTRFRIRRGASPARVDRCIKAGAKEPVRCPSPEGIAEADAPSGSH